MSQSPAITPDRFTSFGELLQFLRHRAGLTQQAFAVKVGYSPSQISRLEKNQRVPDAAAVAARFVPALGLAQERVWAARLLELAASFQLQGEAQPENATPQTPAHNLPHQLTRFIGREKEIAEINRLLSGIGEPQKVRLLTLTGAGGSGKTRLAVQAAAERLADFEDGVWFVDLAPVTDPTLVVPTVMQTLGVTPFPDQTPLEALKESMRHKHLLLVLDNFEQVLEAAISLPALLAAAPTFVLLVTSRVGLHLSAEREFRVPPLPLPVLKASVEELSGNAAVDLFVQRAQAVQQEFQLTQANADAVAEICVRLDGLPLAIELAAARSKVLAPDALLARLTNRFGLLTGGARDVPARQQTLRNTIDWSYRLLKPGEQTLFRRLGVFTGGWTLEAAEQVCHAAADDATEIVDQLDTLLNHNLIRQNISKAGAVRFGMLETLREYALEQLVASGELETLRERHAEYYLAFVSVAVPTPGLHLALESVKRLDEEPDNVRAALAWSLGTSGQAQMGLRLAEAVAGQAMVTDVTQARILLERALAQAEAQGNYDLHARGRVLVLLATYQALGGDYAGGELSLLESLAVFQQLEDQDGVYQSLIALGWTARERGDTLSARARLQEADLLVPEIKNESLQLDMAHILLGTMIMEGDTISARRLLDKIMPRMQQRRENWPPGGLLVGVGRIALLEGKYEEARHHFERGLSLLRETHLVRGIADAVHGLGVVALAQGDGPLAAAHLKEGLAISRSLGYRACMLWCIAGLAATAVLEKEPARAAVLWGAAEALRERIVARSAPAAQATHERWMAEARNQLGEQEFEKALTKGRGLSLEEAIGMAMQSAD